MNEAILSAIVWDPNPNIFTIPYLNHSLKWYGLLFMGGFVAAFFIFIPLLKTKLSEANKNEAASYADGLLWWIIFGAVIGARLGHVFFYDWVLYKNNPIDIFKIWEGGLASHGGTLGVLLAIYLYARKKREQFPEITFLKLCDLLTIPVAFATIFIRIGNFMNQEIVGTTSSLPWAVIFLHPADGRAPIPRHPTQLYEALAYFITFGLLLCLWKYSTKVSKNALPTGLMLGFFFITVFGSRFFIEFVKAEQTSNLFDQTFLQVGQLLSLPFILLGVLLVKLSINRRFDDADSQSQQHKGKVNP